MKVDIEQERCVGAGQCVLISPEVFDQSDDDGLVKLRDASPAPELYGRIREAVMSCPAGVIRLVEAEAT
ncbi:ferredoxin [Streptomyces armeniacus]|uniref:Ferredoxin n=1 Tax=Streptomyces armeniacus TaxID=83291 RepID=A0A345XRD0_9ACTN|nr:ferredoxin [Streptomyces armeniacus]AXK34196.1 ferredoxin [Streptomyces armeniacus]